jgi:hypothetical protein
MTHDTPASHTHIMLTCHLTGWLARGELERLRVGWRGMPRMPAWDRVGWRGGSTLELTLLPASLALATGSLQGSTKPRHGMAPERMGRATGRATHPAPRTFVLTVGESDISRLASP